MNRGTDGRIVNTPLMERFMAYVQPQPNGCMNWTASTRSGYGQLKVDGKMERCHRLAWLLFRGPIPEGMCVLHKCIENRLCVNPDHLYLGTKKNNAEDRKNQGRNGDHKGEANGRSKITEDVVRQIRILRKPFEHKTSEWTYARLVDRFGIPRSTIISIVNNKTWAHLSP